MATNTLAYQVLSFIQPKRFIVLAQRGNPTSINKPVNIDGEIDFYLV